MRRQVPAAIRAARSWPGARRIVLALLVLPPLAALLLLSWATLGHRPRQVHTGDELLDAYLQAVADYGALGTSDSIAPLLNNTALPGALWQEWEQRFGDDPRFWMLCYYMRPATVTPADTDRLYNGWDVAYLREARMRGCADWVVLLNLLRLEYSAWQEAARGALGLAYPNRNSTPQERQRYSARLWDAVNRAHGAELAQLEAELARVGAGQAQAHYYLAQLAIDRGDPAGALGELRAGNAAKDNTTVLGLPFDALLDAAGQGQLLAQDAAISGYLEVAYIPVALPNFLRFKQMIRSLAAEAVARQDAETLQVLHECCCRNAMSEEANYLQAMTASSAEAIVLDAVQDITPDMHSPRGQALSKAQGLRTQIRGALQPLGSGTQSMPTIPSGLAAVAEYTPAASCGWRYYGLEILRGFARELITQQTALSGPVREQFEALAAIDFTQQG